jgi:hypothetical protein
VAQRGAEPAATSAPDLTEHLVEEVAFALAPGGRWAALCGAVVVGAPLVCAPARRCRLCAEVARCR